MRKKTKNQKQKEEILLVKYQYWTSTKWKLLNFELLEKLKKKNTREKANKLSIKIKTKIKIQTNQGLIS